MMVSRGTRRHTQPGSAGPLCRCPPDWTRRFPESSCTPEATLSRRNSPDAYLEDPPLPFNGLIKSVRFVGVDRKEFTIYSY